MIGRDGRTHDDIDAISWIVPRDPAGTLQKLVDTGNINLDEPDASLVLTKPLGLSVIASRKSFGCRNSFNSTAETSTIKAWYFPSP